MVFDLRQARTEDVPQIAAIWNDGWHEAHGAFVPDALTQLRTPQSFADRSRAHIADTRVAVSDAGIVGFCMTDGDEIYQLYVAPTARGTGAAQALLHDGEARIAAAGHDPAWLACGLGNERAMRFYEKCGWRNMGRKRVDVDTSDGPFPLDVWRFEKRGSV